MHNIRQGCALYVGMEGELTFVLLAVEENGGEAADLVLLSKWPVDLRVRIDVDDKALQPIQVRYHSTGLPEYFHSR